MVATHAALAYAEANEVGHLTASLSTRDKIGQAKGILMERYKITDQQAFILLAGVSQNTNTKLTALAEPLTSTGELPGPGIN